MNDRIGVYGKNGSPILFALGRVTRKQLRTFFAGAMGTKWRDLWVDGYKVKAIGGEK